MNDETKKILLGIAVTIITLVITDISEHIGGDNQ